MNFFSKSSILYSKLEYEINEKNFGLTINQDGKKIVGLLMKFVDQNGTPVKLFRSDTYLSICRIIIGDIMNYEIEEKISCDMQHYTTHQQFMNNVTESDVVWTYFFNPYTSNHIKLCFELEHACAEPIYLFVNEIYFSNTKPNTTPQEYIINCIRDDYILGFDSTNIGSIEWMYNEVKNKQTGCNNFVFDKKSK